MDSAYFKDRVIWITGASYGIGKALAEEFSQKGARLALSARSEDKLAKLVSTLPHEAKAYAFDVTDRDANNDIAERIVADFGQLDTVVFNAGTNEYVSVTEFNSEVFEHIMRVNFMSMVYGVEAVLPHLLQSTRPHLVGVSSTAAYVGLPRAEAYGASKAAIRNMLEALSLSLQPHGIPVSVVCPGFVKTPLTDVNDFPMPFLIEADEAARTIAKEMMQYKREIHFPKLFSTTLKLISYLPKSWSARLLAKTVRT
ncbi:MAG TPA: short-chain dehydrogenase [Gammaproteobacteria bacterium]|nr:short-chain dehydrogenase [Gammaproteobacteria bacterium]